MVKSAGIFVKGWSKSGPSVYGMMVWKLLMCSTVLFSDLSKLSIVVALSEEIQ